VSLLNAVITDMSLEAGHKHVGLLLGPSAE